MLKKLFSLVLSLLLVISLGACSSDLPPELGTADTSLFTATKKDWGEWDEETPTHIAYDLKYNGIFNYQEDYHLSSRSIMRSVTITRTDLTEIYRLLEEDFLNLEETSIDENSPEWIMSYWGADTKPIKQVQVPLEQTEQSQILSILNAYLNEAEAD